MFHSTHCTALLVYDIACCYVLQYYSFKNNYQNKGVYKAMNVCSLVFPIQIKATFAWMSCVFDKMDSSCQFHSDNLICTRVHKPNTQHLLIREQPKAICGMLPWCPFFKMEYGSICLINKQTKKSKFCFRAATH